MSAGSGTGGGGGDDGGDDGDDDDGGNCVEAATEPATEPAAIQIRDCAPPKPVAPHVTVVPAARPAFLAR
ncbi:hypothetical protein [Streptomyces sp. NPDC048392]|uniref:hypothetical protein n=1 Tax=Streptomyces sp. NPDC048392 TaxID=3365543 RepID=UPI0037181E48